MASKTQTQEQTQEASPYLSEESVSVESVNQDEKSTNSTSDRLDRVTTLKLLGACFSFLVAGVNDGSIGALLPYIIRDYKITTAVVSSVYGAQFAGWFVAAIVNTHLCQYFDLGIMLSLGAALQMAAHALRAWKPPFPLFIVTFFLVSLGQAFNDTHANTFVASTGAASYRWLALIHASYAVGSLFSPFIATLIASGSSWSAASATVATSSVVSSSRWYLFYACPAGLSVMNLVFISYVFRDCLRFKKLSEDSKKERPSVGVVVAGGDEAQRETLSSRNKDATRLIKVSLTSPSVLLLSLFFFWYMGSDFVIIGWVVEYLVDVRGGDISKMGFVAIGLNGGILLGRLILAELTYRLGERRMVFIYCILKCALHLVFWLVPDIIAASIAVSFFGFFTGPIFATGISVASKLFSSEIHAIALGFVFVSAQMGASLFPIIIGVIAARAGVQVLQPIVMSTLVATAISWLFVPRVNPAVR